MRYMAILGTGGNHSNLPCAPPPRWLPPCWAFLISADWINQPHYFVLFGFNVFTSMFQLGHESNINCQARCRSSNWDTTEICLRCGRDTFEMCHTTILRSATACVFDLGNLCGYVRGMRPESQTLRTCIRVCTYVCVLKCAMAIGGMHI